MEEEDYIIAWNIKIPLEKGIKNEIRTLLFEEIKKVFDNDDHVIQMIQHAITKNAGRFVDALIPAVKEALRDILDVDD